MQTFLDQLFYKAIKFRQSHPSFYYTVGLIAGLIFIALCSYLLGVLTGVQNRFQDPLLFWNDVFETLFHTAIAFVFPIFFFSWIDKELTKRDENHPCVPEPLTRNVD